MYRLLGFSTLRLVAADFSIPWRGGKINLFLPAGRVTVLLRDKPDESGQQ
jgi:hypothetical protein